MKKNFTNLNLEFKAMSEDEEFYHFSGIISTPDIDHAGDIVTSEAMAKSISKYGLPKFLHQHSQDQMPLGTFTEFRQEGEKSILDAKIPKIDNDPFTARLIALIKMRAYGGLSIGYFVEQADDLNGNKISDPRNYKGIRVINELEVIEGSLVSIPCNEFAEILSIKAREMGSDENSIIEMKKIFDESIKTKGEEMKPKLEVKGEALAKVMNDRINNLVNGEVSRADYVAKVARYMNVSEDTVEKILAGDKDVNSDSKLWDISWALDMVPEVLRNASADDSSSSSAQPEVKDLKLESIKDVEKELKEKGFSKKESQTIVSKIAEFKKLSDSDKDKAEKKGLSDSDSELILKSLNELLTK